MLTNYFFLNRLALELNDAISGWTIKEIYTQEKNTLLIQIENSGNSKHIELSADHTVPYITIRHEFHRARKNSIDFFGEVINQKILSVSIAEFDRVIKINLTNSSFYFAVRGKFTNVYFEYESGIYPFKKLEDENYLDDLSNELKNIKFNTKFNYLKPDKNYNPHELRDKFPFLGKEVIQELDLRLQRKKENINILLESVLKDIIEKKPAVFINEVMFETNIAFESFGIYRYDKIVNFDNLTDAINYYLSKSIYFDKLSSLKKKLSKIFERVLSKHEKKKTNLETRIERGSKEELYNQYGNLLLININKIHKGSKNISVCNIYEDNKEINIKLDTSLSAKQNVDKYFEKARDEKIQIEKSRQLLYETDEKIEQIKEKLDKLNSTEGIIELSKEFKIIDQEKHKKQQDLSEKFKHYLLENRYDVFVGRDSKNNDLLTLRFAKPNDYWFHAKSVPGSHTVLRVQNTSENIPKYILENAASIAAFHSKSKNAGVVPVSYTLKKYVVKKKGLDPGQVILLKENVLLVKPEVPKNAEFIKRDE